VSRVVGKSAKKESCVVAVVPGVLAGPLDRAVRGLFAVSWGQARAWIEAGKVRVGDAVVTEVTARVAEGQPVTVDERAARPVAGSTGGPSRGRVGDLGDADVVHVDAQVVVVAKPAGISTVPYEGEDAARDQVDTLDARVRRWIERSARGRGGRPSLGVVHRLDKETSGLVVFTRTWLAKQSLASQFRRHTVYRRYLALAHGDVRTRTFRTFLLDDRGDGLRGSARGTPGARGREAITHVERIEPLGGAGDSRHPAATLVACRLETGRTHQIRIHLSEAGHPLVGERVYVRRYPGPLLEAPRLMLHAAELGFVHPASEREVRWELPMPDDMRAVVDRLRAPRRP
jgi:23S rRNA pseudouridine1911/1915/1917 synthase